MSGLRQQRKLSLWVPIFFLVILAAIVLGNAFPAPAARKITLEAFCGEFEDSAPTTCP